MNGCIKFIFRNLLSNNFKEILQFLLQLLKIFNKVHYPLFFLRLGFVLEAQNRKGGCFLQNLNFFQYLLSQNLLGLNPRLKAAFSLRSSPLLVIYQKQLSYKSDISKLSTLHNDFSLPQYPNQQCVYLHQPADYGFINCKRIQIIFRAYLKAFCQGLTFILFLELPTIDTHQLNPKYIITSKKFLKAQFPQKEGSFLLSPQESSFIAFQTLPSALKTDHYNLYRIIENLISTAAPHITQSQPFRPSIHHNLYQTSIFHKKRVTQMFYQNHQCYIILIFFKITTQSNINKINHVHLASKNIQVLRLFLLRF